MLPCLFNPLDPTEITLNPPQWAFCCSHQETESMKMYECRMDLPGLGKMQKNSAHVQECLTTRIKWSNWHTLLVGLVCLNILEVVKMREKRLKYMGNHMQSSGCKCSFWPALVPPSATRRSQCVRSGASKTSSVHSLQQSMQGNKKSRKMQKKHIRTLSLQVSHYLIRTRLFLWMGTERDTGLEGAAVSTSQSIHWEKLKPQWALCFLAVGFNVSPWLPQWHHCFVVVY